jgi:hypothetical protein
MVRTLATRSIRRMVLLIGVAMLLSVIAGVLPRGPSSIDIPIPITDPVVPPDRQLQAEPIDIPLPTSDPFIG